MVKLHNRAGRKSAFDASSTALTKCSRFILHPQIQRSRPHRVAFVAFFFVVTVIVLAVSFILLFLFLFFFLVWLLSKEDIGRFGGIRMVCVEAL
jgi:hypothetical protein